MKRLVKILLLTVIAVGLSGLAWLVVQPQTALAPWSLLPKTNRTIAPLKFAVMSDLHSDLANLTKALAQAKANAVSFVIVTGDLTEVGTTEQLQAVKEVLDDSGLTYYAVPGNHDYWQSRNISEPLFQQVFGYNYTSVTKSGYSNKLSQNYKLILVDNGDDYKGLGEEQELWLTSELTDCGRLRCLVLMHEPLNHPTSEHIMGEGHVNIASEAATLRQELVAAGVKDIFAGHLHSSHRYNLDGLTTRIIGSTASERNWQTPRFLEVTLGETLEEKEIEIK